MMVEKVGILENMKEDEEELEMLLGEIPHATSSFSLHHHHHSSYANSHHHYNYKVVNGDPYVKASNVVNVNDTQSHHEQGIAAVKASNVAPTLNRMMYGMYDNDNGHSSPSRSSSSSHDPMPKPYIFSRNPYLELPESSFRNEVDESLVDGLGRMYIDQGRNEGLLCDNRISLSRFGDSDYLPANPHFSRIPVYSGSEMNPVFFGFQQNCGISENVLSQLNFERNVLNYGYQWGIPGHIGMNSMYESGVGLLMQNVPYVTWSKAKSNPNPDPNRFHMAGGGSPNIRNARGGLDSGLAGLAASEESLIIQGEDLSRVRKRLVSPCEFGRTKVDLSCFSHLTEARRRIFLMAKDQHGCRLLQKIFDDGNPQHVQIVFNEIIGHVVELMINPFGNYLMQKLLEVCNEEQRMHILMAITRERRELVQISLNTHGTRVVQKLIETIKTRQEIKLVISALEPGFLALIKDLNGNHVIQRCLQCLSNEDNKFIFEAATKFCVEIATHQHGCCVLQRCISHATGEHHEKLVSEISKNGFLLAQDAFGNYVVQYILEQQIPSAVSKLTSQFEGNYVHLATQKFSSHVVEKCLAISDGQIRSTIIRELILATHFEQLLQDPHANYVVQTALRVSEGPLHDLLVNVIESHKAISRSSPYSKRIFSHKLLRR